ncbi:MAG TPA: RHS repeat-associated core domain-containing protein [Candidatus Acidoferrum sp.]|nr:RHS repeat-associated core domain-containing protein [Candidatus Acidoferrum sp.]
MEQVAAQRHRSASLPTLGMTQRSYYRARYYDQAGGRFMSEDPLKFDGGIDFYAYVSNNPVVSTDPLGLAGCPPNVVAYIKQMCSAAKAASGPNCPIHIMLIQSGFESAWGTGPTVPDNNFFGLHGIGDRGWRPAKRDPNVKLPIFSTPAAGFGEYCNRVKEKGIGYSNDSQFLNQVVSKLGFAVGGDPAGYKRGIQNMLNKCKPDLDSCSCSEKK